MREHLGIQAFGVNAFTQNEEGLMINEHDESGGQEELYVVLDGNATFEIDGETVDAPAGTLPLRRARSAPEGDRRGNRARHRRARPDGRTRDSTGARHGRSTAHR